MAILLKKGQRASANTVLEPRKSFLKWAGGKAKLVNYILSLMPEYHKAGRYMEPFVGSGAVALNVPHDEIIIADTNDALIALWCQIRDNPNFIERASAYFQNHMNNEDTYYVLRKRFNDSLKHWNEGDVAVLFLYLNRHGFNGLCRFNKSGEFNVPFGKYDKPYFPELELKVASVIAKRMAIRHQGFEETMESAREGDVVYCDPPYLGLSDTSNFTAYSKGGFSFHQQVLLADRAHEAATRGATVIVSNNATKEAEIVYRHAHEKFYLDVNKMISCKGDGRKKQREILAVYRP